MKDMFTSLAALFSVMVKPCCAIALIDIDIENRMLIIFSYLKI
ncbi:MAG: hypothetical protein WDM90_00070 [Ferruginibacter sp.]